MSRYFEFMQNHPVLVGSFAALLVLFFILEGKRSGKKVSANQLGLLTNNQNAEVIDLREPKDFNQGHISGSRNIPYSRLKDHMDELKAATHPLVFVCKMGTIAGSAVAQLHKPDAYRLDGGIMSWQSQGLPLIGAKTEKQASRQAGKNANKAKKA